ncbi:MAG: CaiB/BaiF CoA transferase family protein, partial [Gammaproteobacteria bacterium]
MPQPFAGLRVIDFTQVLAGPFATQQLALLGADVIKIEQPGVGDQTRELMNNGWLRGSGASPAFLSLNVGKRSLALDLKAPAARDIVLALVRGADVVVENLRPGAMQRLGFDYPTLAAVRPDLIYCAISGYGQTGPRAGTPAYDGAIQADSGMMSINGHPETGPTRTGYMPVDMATALNSAFAIAAALYRRQATGAGQYIDVAMMDTALVLQTAQVSNWLVHGDELGLVGNLSATGQPTASVFPTRDGHVQIIALRDGHVRALLGALGVPGLADTPDFATAPARIEAAARIRTVVSDLTRRETTAHWLQALAAAGVPVA